MQRGQWDSAEVSFRQNGDTCSKMHINYPFFSHESDILPTVHTDMFRFIIHVRSSAQRLGEVGSAFGPEARLALGVPLRFRFCDQGPADRLRYLLLSHL